MSNEYEKMPDPFALTVGDKVSSTWRRLAEHLQEELRVARGKNDTETLDPVQTAILRGQIKTLKRIIALGDTLPVTTDS